MKKIFLKHFILTIIVFIAFTIFLTNNSNAFSTIYNDFYSDRQAILKNIPERNNSLAKMNLKSSSVFIEGTGGTFNINLNFDTDVDYTKLRCYIKNSSLYDVTPGFNVVYNKTSSNIVKVTITIAPSMPADLYQIEFYYGENLIHVQDFRIYPESYNPGGSGFTLSSCTINPNPLVAGVGGTIVVNVNGSGSINALDCAGQISPNTEITSQMGGTIEQINDTTVRYTIIVPKNLPARNI